MKRYFFGLFPPPYGGVTMKNELLYGELKKSLDIQKIDIEKAKRRPDLLAMAFLKLVFLRKGTFVVATSVRGRRSITKVLYRFNRKAMQNTILIVMGGVFAKKVAKDAEYAKKLKCYKSIYVETETMRDELVALGFNKVKIYPNGRKNTEFKDIRATDKNNFKCLFFSRVSKDKGVDIILNTAKEMPDICFVIYGEIDDDYKMEFEENVSCLSNVTYEGVFRGSSVEACSLMSEYDVVLFPTRCTTEGVPGILVEAKLAGVPAIVSNLSYNSELVKHREEGYVLDKCDVNSMYDAINELRNDEKMTDAMKLNARKSSQRYDINNYIEDIINDLR